MSRLSFPFVHELTSWTVSGSRISMTAVARSSYAANDTRRTSGRRTDDTIHMCLASLVGASCMFTIREGPRKAGTIFETTEGANLPCRVCYAKTWSCAGARPRRHAYRAEGRERFPHGRVRTPSGEEGCRPPGPFITVHVFFSASPSACDLSTRIPRIRVNRGG